MNNAPATTKPKQKGSTVKANQPKQQTKEKNKKPKVVADSHQCDVCEIPQVKVVDNSKQVAQENTIKRPFDIQTSQLKKYILYGEILATPVCRKQRRGF